MRHAVVLADGLGVGLRPAPFPRLPLHAGDPPLATRLVMELAAFGIREVLLVARSGEAEALGQLDGAEVGGARVRVAPVAAPLIPPLAGAAGPILLVEAGARFGDLACFLAAPLAAGSARLLELDGAPTGVALLGAEAARAWPTLPGQVERWPGEGAATDFALPAGDGEALARLDAGLRRPAAFLDRDGVINVDDGYTFETHKLVFTATAIPAIRALNRRGHRVIVVTNQSGVARGLYGIADVERFHEHLQDRLLAEGAHVDAFYYCAYHPDGIVAEFAVEHEDRKPGAGMIRRAMRDWAVPAAGSFMVGDKDSDMAAAAAAGLPGLQVRQNVCDLAAEIDAFVAGL